MIIYTNNIAYAMYKLIKKSYINEKETVISGLLILFFISKKKKVTVSYLS